MQINLKNLKGQLFSIEVGETQTFAEVKEKLRAGHGFAVERQKIVLKGKTMANEQKVGELGVKETDCFLLMVQTTRVRSSPQHKMQEQQEEEKNDEDKKIKQELKKEESKDMGRRSWRNQPRQQQIVELMEMGFSKAQVMVALEAADNSTHRAVEFLLNGIPKNLKLTYLKALKTLINQPQLSQIQMIMRITPIAIPIIIDQLSNIQELYELIKRFPEEFQSMMMGDDDKEEKDEDADENEEAEGEDGENGEEGEEGEEGQDGDESQFLRLLRQLNMMMQGGGLGQGMQGGLRQGMHEGQGQGRQGGHIVFNAQGNQAIERLVTLGFTKNDAAQAYVTCEKNQQYAAILLFERQDQGLLSSEDKDKNSGPFSL